MKNHKKKSKVCEKPDFGSESRLRVGKVLAPYNARPKMIPLIKRAKRMWFSKYLIFPKSNNKRMYKINKNNFFGFFGPDKD